VLYLRLHVGDALQEQLELTAERVTIGRAADNDIVLPGGGVSKHHAVIEKQGESFVVVDCGSANGVYVNGARVHRQPLNYWDEIQIFHYVLKVMAVARLPGESSGALRKGAPTERQDATMEVDIASLGDLARLRRRADAPYLTVERGAAVAGRLPLNKVNFLIGRDRAADLRLKSWFAPRLAVGIQRRNDGFYLLPKRRGRVTINGQAISSPVKLADHDAFTVRGLALRFHLRPADDA
jgi:pSer/pThr/pTyr-binding forkhead associated (FHA) protein